MGIFANILKMPMMKEETIWRVISVNDIRKFLTKRGYSDNAIS